MQILKQAKLAAQKMKASINEEAVSVLHTFVAAFLIEVGSHLGEISVGSVSRDVLIAVLFAAVRSGVKAILLLVASKLKK